MGGRRKSRNKQEGCPLCGCKGGRPWSTKLSVIAKFLRLEYSCQTSFSCLLPLGCKGCLCSRITPQALGHNIFYVYHLRFGGRSFSSLVVMNGWNHCRCNTFGILTPISNLLLSLLWCYGMQGLPFHVPSEVCRLSYVIARVEGLTF